VVNSYQYKGLLVVAEMAEILGKTEDAANYRAMAADLKAAVNATFDSDGDGIYVNGMKHDGTLITGTATPATIYPLLHGLVDDETAYATGLKYVADKGFTGSVFGAQFMLELMYAADNGDRAYELLTDTGIRSWYHMIYDLGATITTEAWDVSHKPNMTFSHPWGSAAGNAIVEGLGGIKPLEAGYSKIQIKPQIGELEFITLTAPTIKGSVKVGVDTRKATSLADMTVTVPANTTAKVYVPTYGAAADVLVVDSETVAATREGDYFVLDNLGSGTHTFSIPVAYKMVAKTDSEA